MSQDHPNKYFVGKITKIHRLDQYDLGDVLEFGNFHGMLYPEYTFELCGIDARTQPAVRMERGKYFKDDIVLVEAQVEPWKPCEVICLFNEHIHCCC